MYDIKWSKSEKKTARRAFDVAYKREWLTIDDLKGLSEDKLDRIKKLLTL
jgi:hypothetical protein